MRNPMNKILAVVLLAFALDLFVSVPSAEAGTAKSHKKHHKHAHHRHHHKKLHVA
jgi:hypothetical protein